MGENVPSAGRKGSNRVSRPRRRSRILARVCAAVLGVALAACSSAPTASPASEHAAESGNVSGHLVVFAAASLSAAFNKIGDQFEKAHPGVTLKFNYAGSSSLVTSIKQGAPADVFASANPQNMTAVTDAGLASGTPQTFARNQAEIMVAKGNPKNIKSVDDLANPALKVVLCASEVPCGSLAKQVFDKAGVTVKPVSEETSVSGVVTKVSLGEADAGLVYETDVKAGGDKVEGVPIPADQNVIVDYPIVKVKDAPNANAAKAFISYVLSPPGQEVLKSYGFLPPG